MEGAAGDRRPSGRRRRVLATLVAVEGILTTAAQLPEMLIDGEVRIGSISGGCLEEDLVERSKRVAANGRPEVVVYDTLADDDVPWGVGLGCHGIVRILLERVPAAARLGGRPGGELPRRPGDETGGCVAQSRWPARHPAGGRRGQWRGRRGRLGRDHCAPDGARDLRGGRRRPTARPVRVRAWLEG